jgi:uncharacterized OB-fold protein
MNPIRDGLFQRDPPALLGSRCGACGAVRFPACDVCGECQSTQVENVALATTGTVYTYTVIRHKPPGYLGDVPYAFGFVDLADGLRVISTLVAGDLDTLAISETVDFELFALGAVESYRYRRREAPR